MTSHIRVRRVRTRTVNVRGLVYALDGHEKKYPVYRFSAKRFYERPKHNPFAGL